MSNLHRCIVFCFFLVQCTCIIRVIYGMGHKKVPVFCKRLCNRNFAFRFRACSVVHISVFIFAAWAKVFYARGTVKKR